MWNPKSYFVDMNEILSRIARFITRFYGNNPPNPDLNQVDPPTSAEDEDTGSPAPDPSQPSAGAPQDSADLRPDDPVTIIELPVQEDPVDTALSDPAPGVTDRKQRYLWCIDNGHGALTRGKRSPLMEDGQQLLEYEFNRDVTSRIFVRLHQLGVAYYNVVPEVQVGNFLLERVRRVNDLESELPKLFVSVHANAGPAPSLQDYTSNSSRGVETWHYFGSTRGRDLAAIFQRHLVEQTGLKNRQLRAKRMGQFYVLRATTMPAVLTESGFYNNRLELPLMLTDAFRKRVAEAHVLAILEVERVGI